MKTNKNKCAKKPATPMPPQKKPSAQVIKAMQKAGKMTYRQAMGGM